jgi:lysophospholipase L1-like esterase
MRDDPHSILCYGDSNTWGYRTPTEDRFPRWVRWPGILQRELGDGFHVVEEGLGGRTTVFDVPGEPDRNGLTPLPMLLESHSPLDLVIVALGVNDVFLPGITSAWVARGVERLVETIRATAFGRDAGPPGVLVIAPPSIGPLPPADAATAPDARAESSRLADEYRRVCEPLGVEVMDLAGVCEPTVEDGVHFDAEAHRSIGLAVAERVRALVP